MKKILALILAATMLATATGCNKTIIDTTYKFDRAIISLPNGGVIEGKIETWKDYEDGDQIQVKIDGKTYLAHSEDVVLISE